MSQVPIRLVVLALALAGAIVLFDLSLPLGVAGGVPYVVLVLIGLWFPDGRSVLWLAAAGSVLTIAGYFLSAPSAPSGIHWMVMTNRGLALFAIWATAILVYQRRQAEEQSRMNQLMAINADQANFGKSQFLAAASHDLRQPLQSISLYLSALDQLLDQAKQNEISEKIHGSLDVMGELLDALLDISKLDSGSVTPTKKDFLMSSFLDALVADNESAAQLKGLTFRCSADSCVVHSDPALLRRIVENFITNAIRYTDTGGVEVRCEEHDGYAWIKVKDSGIGIPEEALDTIFEEYFQLDNPARDRRKGLGLGLSIVKHIARLLDHRLSVTSIPGEGSTFAIAVPLGEPLEQVAEAPEPAAEPNRSKRDPVVLLIDDDLAIVDATTMLLSSAAIKVYSALNGDEALAHIDGGVQPDIILSDYRLPGYNGIEVIRRIRKAAHDDLPAVVMT
ncbi:MAG: hybrid sensor histidine kinase/response regulator, partial [Gammaproteobacteria bacterium]|nr:hybrid sensor histidine kinase/response regulator [Gammaproteobacteria bacterium]